MIERNFLNIFLVILTITTLCSLLQNPPSPEFHQMWDVFSRLVKNSFAAGFCALLLRDPL